ncbi:MAG: Gloeo Verruco repeat-containing protein, partial [Verrucomicrobiaceae bacterium]|nr:Gloeo Verruco repeat-containing protein [Verrucomicrobiaceae bacterium]
VTYQWMKGPTTLHNGPNPLNSTGVISGATSSKLTITKGISDDAGAYTCMVTMPDPQHAEMPLTRSSGMFTVSITIKPIIDAFTPGPWIVSGTVNDVITAQNHPTGFTLSGQPAGVSIDAAGHFHGKPTVTISVPTVYHLVISSSNAAGPALVTQKADVTVNPLPADVVGTFNGLVDRDAALTSGHGGTLSIATLASGVFSGKLTLGALSYSFSAQRLDSTVGGVVTPSTVTIVRSLPLHNLTLALTFNHDTAGDPSHVGSVVGTVTDVSLPASPISLLGWRAVHQTTFATVYTSALEIDPSIEGTASPHEANIIYPQGDGYGCLMVTAAGAATWSGRMADGTVTTANVTMGTHGEVPLHFMLYTHTGSAHGWVQVSGTDPNLLLDSVGPFNWVKAAQTASTLSYSQGFPLHSLKVIGAKYIKPTAASPLVMSIPAVTSGTNGGLLFSEGGLTALTYAGPPAVNVLGAVHAADLASHATFRITGTAAANKVIPPSPNPATLSIAITASSGVFNGSFILHGDPDPTKAAPALVNRTGIFSGICVMRSFGAVPFVQGAGYFLLPQLQPSPGLIVTKAPLLSGQVLMQKMPQ